MLAGVLIAESLRVGAQLTGVPLQIIELARVEMTSTGVDQPRYWTPLYFTAAESEASRPAAELPTCLAPTGGWYTDFHTATDTFVVFADKVSATYGVRPKTAPRKGKAVMSNEHASCVFCGEFVLHIPGWASSVPSYRLMRATWQEEHAFVVGSLHFSCLRASPARSEFAAEFAQIATGHGREITYQAAGETQTLIQPGLGYVEQIFRGDECAIHRSDTRDSWLVQEYAGPWYVLDRPQLEDIAQGKQPRLDPGVERIVLPREPMANLADATLPELLDSLGVTDRYPGLAAGEPEYEFWKYFAPKRVLEYAVIATPPLPAEAAAFLRDYAPGYRPIDFDALERDDPRS